MSTVWGIGRLGLWCVGVCWALDASPFPPGVAPPINDCVHGPTRPQAGTASPRAFVSFLGFRGPGRGCFSQESSLSPAAAKCRLTSTGNTDRCDSHDFSGASASLSAPLCTRIQTFLVTPTCVASCRHADPLTYITPHVGPICQVLATHRCLWTFVDLPHSNHLTCWIHTQTPSTKAAPAEDPW